MNSGERSTFIVLPETEFRDIQQTLQEIKEVLASRQDRDIVPAIIPDYIPAAAFMKAVNIKRTKLHELITSNKIKTLKKRRKVYVLATEVKRYFSDPSIR